MAALLLVAGCTKIAGLDDFVHASGGTAAQSASSSSMQSSSTGGMPSGGGGAGGEGGSGGSGGSGGHGGMGGLGGAGGQGGAPEFCGGKKRVFVTSLEYQSGSRDFGSTAQRAGVVGPRLEVTAGNPAWAEASSRRT